MNLTLQQKDFLRLMQMGHEFIMYKGLHQAKKLNGEIVNNKVYKQLLANNIIAINWDTTDNAGTHYMLTDYGKTIKIY